MTPKKTSAPPKTIFVGLALIFLLVGLYARLKGLGTWSLGIDEYFLATSIDLILEKGLPAFDCGGYYTRGLLYQYLNAGILLISPFDPVITMRGVNVFFNLVMLPAVFLITMRLTKSSNAALVAVSLLSLSLWEIEFARYFRMYTLFQALFIWYLFCLYRALVEEHSRAFMCMLILSAISVFVHEGSIFLIALNVVPVILVSQFRQPSRIFVVLALLIGSYFYLTFDFRHLGIEHHLPTSVSLNLPKSSYDKISYPFILASTFGANQYWLTLFVPLIAGSAWIAYKIASDTSISALSRITLLVLGITSILNLFSIVVFGVILSMTIQWLSFRHLHSNAFKRFLRMVAMWMSFWFVYGLFTNEWKQWFTDQEFNEIKKLLVVFFKYPDLYTKVVYQWFITIPLTTIILSVPIMLGVFTRLKNDPNKYDGFLFLCFILILVLLIMSVLVTPYYSTRYTFFIFPLVVILATSGLTLFLNAINTKAKTATTVLSFYLFVYIFVSEDVNIKHLRNVDSLDINFRLIYSDNLAGHYWYRRDYKTPAEFITRQLKKDEIIASTLRAPNYYLKKMDYMYVDKDHLWALSGCNGEKEIWTNANLVYRESEFINLLNKLEKSTWVLAYSHEYPYQSDLEKHIETNFSNSLVYKSKDRRINVYKINP